MWIFGTSGINRIELCEVVGLYLGFVRYFRQKKKKDSSDNRRKWLVSYCCMKCTRHPNFRGDGSVQYFKTTLINQCCFSVRYVVTDLWSRITQAKYISITNVIIVMSAYCTLHHLHESKDKFSVHNGVRASRTSCELHTAGQMSCDPWGCEFVLIQPAVGPLPELEMFSVCSFQCAGGVLGDRWCRATVFDRLNNNNWHNWKLIVELEVILGES